MKKHMINTDNNMSESDVAYALVTRRRRLSLVWIVPIVALVIGFVLTYKYYSEKGENITIIFNQASGIIAGKTKVRFRDVDVGVVTGVTFTPDLQNVAVSVEMNPSSKPYLNDKTIFWLERPRLTLTEVSGLETLLSGVYIGVELGHGKKTLNSFTALPEAPLVGQNNSGRFFTLKAKSKGSLVERSPIYFHGFEAGKVVSTHLDGDKKQAEIRVFIESPYDQYVYTNTSFWNVSGVQVDAGANGVKIKTESLVSVLIGGLTFDVPKYELPKKVADEDTEFKLFSNQEEAFQRYYAKQRVVMFFKDSLRGLTVGAPVTVRGMPYGQVVDIRAIYDTNDLSLTFPVTVELEPERFEHVGVTDKGTPPEIMEQIIEKGFRAQLKTGSLITGQLYIDMDLHTNAPPAKLVMFEDMPVLPTIQSTFDTLTDRVDLIASNIVSITQQLREDVAPEVTDTLREIKGAVGVFNKDVTPELSSTLQEIKLTASGLHNDVTPEVTTTLMELREAARSLRMMADYLERHPEALLKGKKGSN